MSYCEHVAVDEEGGSGGMTYQVSDLDALLPLRTPQPDLRAVLTMWWSQIILKM